MNVYHKIQTVFKRDPETKYKTLLMGEYSLIEFEYLRYNDWVWTEKINGTNIRVIYDDFLTGDLIGLELHMPRQAKPLDPLRSFRNSWEV